MLQSSLLKITGILYENAIPYMVIGGYAVVYHGESRFTEDIDITLGIDNDQLDRLLAVLKGIYTIRIDQPVDFVRKTNVLPVRDNETSVPIDLIFSFIDYEREAIKRSISVTIDTHNIQIISASDLIIYKLIAGRARDIDDAKSILERRLDVLDIDFIDRNLAAMSELIGRQDIYNTWETLRKKMY